MDTKLPLHEIHENLGGKMIPFAGFLMPVRYSGDKQEHLAVREGVGIFDVSHMGEFLLKGPDSVNLLQKVTTNDITKLKPGKAQYNCLPNDQGGIVDDLIVYMIEEDHYFLVVNASNIEKDWVWITGHAKGLDLKLENVSNQYCLFAIQGPKTSKVLQKLTSVNLADISFYHFEIGEFAGVDDIIISATGYTGSGGFEIYVKNESAVEVWNKIMEAGQDEGIMPIGLGARDTLRMEMGYCLYGNDINDTTSPIEAGLSWITKFTKDFIGRELAENIKKEGVKRKLVGFKMTEKGIPRAGYELQDSSGNKIGEVTSGTMSPSLNIGIGMGYVKTEFSEPGTSINIQIRNKLVAAEVAKMPLIK